MKSIYLDVEDEDVLARARDDSSQTVHEVREERREEGFLGHVLEAYCHGVEEHRLRHQPHLKTHLGRDFVETICKERNLI